MTKKKNYSSYHIEEEKLPKQQPKKKGQQRTNRNYRQNCLQQWPELPLTIDGINGERELRETTNLEKKKLVNSH